MMNLPAVRETWVRSLGWEHPLEKGTAPTPVFRPGKFHGQRSLAGYSPRGHKESDMTEVLSLFISRKVKTQLKHKNRFVLYEEGAVTD